ncbi:T9SS type B sorting domain-containing protein [Neolewinella persica]|uniref:T9SS type B sorting domain-containing protein n=1 Tax=Neolewinella persica TaxID=70998 RepID=UPI001FE1289E|nr:gliding motility-associated C-terminal domain-containing protein [Neolewinella persica]
MFILLFSGGNVFAQPEPCGDTPAMTSNCLDACAICDIDGFRGRNNSTLRGQRVDNFCTTFNHNMGFVAFIAGTENLSIEVTVENCNPAFNSGLEIGLFESFDCETFVPVSGCNTDVAPNTTVPFSNTVPLVVGQHYYLIMDGSGGDVCDWVFKVVEGSTAVGQLTTSGTLSNIPETCPGLPTHFEAANTEAGAALFHWEVDGQRQRTTNQPEVDLSFPSDGNFEVCVVAANVCDEAPASCTTINVRTPNVFRLDTTICQDQFITVADTILRTSGAYDFVVVLPNGCDSMIFVALEVLPQARESIDVNLCVGDEFFIGDTPYSTTGVFQDTIMTVAACDSIVTLDLFMIECEIRGATRFLPPRCRGEATGQLIFSVENGTPPFSYDWSNILEPTVGGAGTTILFQDNAIEGVPVGTYEINVRDDFGNDVVFFQEVMEPTELTVMAESRQIDEYNLSCFGGADGEATALGMGGVPPYAFAWSDTQVGARASELIAGTYIVNLTDANGCVRSASTAIVPPPAIDFSIDFTDPNCDGLETGIVGLSGVTGGTPPFTVALNGGNFDTLLQYEALSPGNYTLVIKDDNGCIADSSSVLTAADIPVIFPWERLVTQLGCDIIIPTLLNNTSVASLRWDDPTGTLDCDTCLQPRVLPLDNSLYVLTVISDDNCSTTDSLTVRVEKNREVYPPTAFSPNGDGVNDSFTLGLGKAAVALQSLRVFDRWGGQVFGGSDLPVNSNGAGWNGRVDEAPAPPGSYVWVAEVLYLDGVILQFQGEVMLLR